MDLQVAQVYCSIQGDHLKIVFILGLLVSSRLFAHSFEGSFRVVSGSLETCKDLTCTPQELKTTSINISLFEASKGDPEKICFEEVITNKGVQPVCYRTFSEQTLPGYYFSGKLTRDNESVSYGEEKGELGIKNRNT